MSAESAPELLEISQEVPKTQWPTALVDSDEVLFVIRGEDKRVLFEAAVRGENDLPVARLLAACEAPLVPGSAEACRGMVAARSAL